MANYYYDQPRGWKRYSEGVIPLLILLLIAVVLIGKTTPTFCGVPGLNQVLCTRTGEVHVGIIGTLTTGNTQIGAEKFKDILDTQGAQYQVYYRDVSLDILEYPREQMLEEFDLLIVTGETNLSYAQRDAVGNYLSAGGKVIVIGDAGTLDTNDPLVKGWSVASFGDNSPVRLDPKTSEQTGIPVRNVNNVILTYWTTHSILHDYADRYKLNLSEVATECGAIKVVDVEPMAESQVIALFQGEDASGDSDHEFAIIERAAGISGGKVLYFNYDPGCTRGIAFTSIRYLAGR